MNQRIFKNPNVKDKVTFLKTAAETNGEYTLLEVELAPGGGNPLHYHLTYAETFTPVTGNLGVQLGNQTRLLKPGEAFTVLPKLVHRFYNPGAHPITFLTELRPASIGFEKFIKILYGLASDGLTTEKGIPKNWFYAALITSLGDTHGVGVLRLTKPVIELVAFGARKAGLEEKLLKKYARHNL
ncbi:cupin domain-containing protein [Adhaeribacter aquaticus]|uniref:cupin domain-containing protein n=1 Tax=Adhaeribacter aquaticus TaxID=299567 RepID=UPI00047DC111|nr:cupin domain-containing protein [Adhaeribacter aquaticus]